MSVDPKSVAPKKCIVCGGVEFEAHLDERLVRCPSCSLVRAADRFFELDPSAVYGRDYFEGQDFVPGEKEYIDYNRERRALRRNFRRRARLLARLAPDARDLLEIGSGYGFFLEVASERWHAEGFEISAHAAGIASASGLRCTNADFLRTDRRTAPDSAASQVPPGSDQGVARPDFEIACLWDTIEHLAEPREMIEKLAADLRPDGVLAVSTGDIGTLLPRWQGSRWRMIHPPTHLWYFSRRTLVALLESVGLEIVRVVYPFYYRSLRTYLGRLARRLPETIGDLPVPLQTGDLIEVYARKPRDRSRIDGGAPPALPAQR